MLERRLDADRRDQQEAGGGYFAPAGRAGQMLLTTFEADGAAASAHVRGVADGGRAYFWAWDGSGSVRRLRHVGAVQVTTCGARGLLTYGLPLNATARLLHGAEASRAAGKLARGYPVRHRFLIPLLQWARRRHMVVCELVADAAAEGHGQGLEGLRAAGRRDGHPRENAVRASREVGRVQTRVPDYGAASISCVWHAPGHVNPLRAGGRRPAAAGTTICIRVICESAPCSAGRANACSCRFCRDEGRPRSDLRAHERATGAQARTCRHSCDVAQNRRSIATRTGRPGLRLRALSNAPSGDQVVSWGGRRRPGARPATWCNAF